MTDGKFFSPEFLDDDDKSTDIFRYKLLKSNYTEIIAEKYPIYVTLKSDSIEFNFQGKIVSRDDKIPFIFGQVPLLIIPLGAGADITGEEIEKVFGRELGIKWYLTEKSDELYYFIKEPDQAIHDLSFSSLSCFGLKKVDWSAMEKREDKDKDKDKDKLGPIVKKKFLRRMLLDFLEEFFLGRVFRFSPYYTELYKKLYDIPIIQGIFLKANFALNERICLNKMTVVPGRTTSAPADDSLAGNTPDKIVEPVDHIEAYMYLDALDKWSHFMARGDTKGLFAPRKSTRNYKKIIDPEIEPEAWLDYVDVEIMNALWHSGTFRSNVDDGTRKAQKARIRKRSVNFLVSEFEIIKAIRILFSLNDKMFRIVLAAVGVISVLLFWAFHPKGGPNLITYGHYKFSETGAIAYRAFDMLFYPVILLSTVAAIPFLYQTLGRIYLKSYLLSKVSFLPKKFRRATVFGISSLSIFLNVIFIVLPIVVIGATAYYYDLSKLVSSNWKWLIFYISIFLSFGAACFFACFLASEAINIILPRLQIAVTTSWIAILSPLDFWKIGFNVSVRDAVEFAMGVLLITAVYLFVQIRKTSNIQNITKIIWKLINVMVPGFMLSVSIGFLGMSILSKRHMTQNSFFTEPSVREIIFQVNETEFDKQQLLQKKDSLQQLKSIRLVSQALLKQKPVDRKERTTKKAPELVIDSSADTLREIQCDIDSIERILRSDNLFKRAHKMNIVTSDSLFAEYSSEKKIEHLRANPKFMKGKQMFSYSFLVSDFSRTEVFIMPGFLILMASFALFSGIFLTLLVDGKPVTEPL